VKLKTKQMTQSEKTKLIEKAGSFVNEEVEVKRHGGHDALRTKFIIQASDIYGVNLETLLMILK
jgi:translation initiation factor IF-2